MGPLEFGIIALLILFLFGSRRLPDLGNALGETVGYVREKSENRVE